MSNGRGSGGKRKGKEPLSSDLEDQAEKVQEAGPLFSSSPAHPR